MPTKINCHPYPCEIWFTTSRKKFNRLHKKIFGEDNLCELGAGIVVPDMHRQRMIIGVFDDSADTLVHEVSHLVIDIFNAVGMEVNIETTEAFAYLFESIFSQCFKIQNNDNKRT
ncbi:hypothetical protein [Martelella alba]|uniref:Uncharacterized protein n=1 Tax=Martelella alba TaxID=2590451 RepID=A0ABY2SFU7_9HYPH|nr:hypothetical protein [Martelella alba]TKI02958.1 hypothetical protein FCN80_23395 [Martelella alba]